jgi:NhaC family Na+:H+ antiporter
VDQQKPSTQLGQEPETNPTKGEKAEKEIRLPNVFWALVPIFTMVGLMVYVFGFVADTDRYDAAHMPLLCSTVVARV